jgi:hypothetical protein
MSFQVKDSGKRQQFEGGMVRDTTEGKIDYDRIYDGPMADRWADHLTKGNVKYPDVEPGVPNWMLADGIAEYTRARKSAARHYRQWRRGDTDEDHAAAVFFNINLKEYVQEKLEARGVKFVKGRAILPTTQEKDKRDAVLGLHEPQPIIAFNPAGDVVAYSSHVPPTAAEIAHAKNTQQRFLSGLEAETGDFEYDEARRIQEQDTHAELAATVLDEWDRTTVSLEDQAKMREFLSTVPMFDGTYSQDQIMEQYDAAEKAQRNQRMIDRLKAGEFDPDYYQPDGVNRDKCGTTNGYDAIDAAWDAAQDAMFREPVPAGEFDLLLANGGGVIVRKSVAKAMDQYAALAEKVFGAWLYETAPEDVTGQYVDETVPYATVPLSPATEKLIAEKGWRK